MARLYLPLSSCGSVVLLLCYLTRSMGHPLYAGLAPRQPGAHLNIDVPQNILDTLGKKEMSALQKTETLKIHSALSGREVGPSNVQKLPFYLQGTSGRSVAFYTMWPHNGELIPSIAKGIAGPTPFEEEIVALKEVGDLVDVGWVRPKAVKIWWVIMKDWTAKQYNMAPIYVIMAHAHRQQALTQQHCFQRFKEAFPVIEMEMRRLVTKYGLLHEDLNMHNVLFSQALTEAVFVDWGLYSRQKEWNRAADEELSIVSKSFQDTEAHFMCGDGHPTPKDRYPRQLDMILEEEHKRGGSR